MLASSWLSLLSLGLISSNVCESVVTNITLEFIDSPLNYSVLNHSHSDLPPENRGIECGQVSKINDTYHLFVTELLSPPCNQSQDLYWCNTHIAHWISTDKLNWTRKATIASGNGNCVIQDHNNMYGSPLYEYKNNHWWLTYVGYDIPCNDYPHHGIIWLSKANNPGFNGINGNFTNLQIQIMNESGAEWWEGPQGGVDSFSSIYYDINGTMWSFYGSCCNFNASIPDYKWGVGLVYSPTNTMNGPWIRYENNPINFTGGIENPIVTVTSSGYYLVVFCVNLQELNGCGFGWSLDGIHWSETQVIGASQPIPYCRVPLGLIEEDNGTFTLFYTDFDERHAGNTDVWEGYEGLYVSNFRLIVYHETL